MRMAWYRWLYKHAETCKDYYRCHKVQCWTQENKQKLGKVQNHKSTSTKHFHYTIKIYEIIHHREKHNHANQDEIKLVFKRGVFQSLAICLLQNVWAVWKTVIGKGCLWPLQLATKGSKTQQISYQCGISEFMLEETWPLISLKYYYLFTNYRGPYIQKCMIGTR